METESQAQAKVRYLCGSCIQAIHPFATIIPDFDVRYDDELCGWCQKEGVTRRTDWLIDPRSLPSHPDKRGDDLNLSGSARAVLGLD